MIAAPVGEAPTLVRRSVVEADIIQLILADGWARAARLENRHQCEIEAKDLLQNLVEAGLSFGTVFSGARLFDPVEVINFSRRKLSRSRRDQEAIVDQARWVAWEPYGLSDQNGPPDPSKLANASYHLTHIRRFNTSLPPQKNTVRLRLPWPIDDAQITDLKTELIVPGELEAASSVYPGRLDFKVKAPIPSQSSVGFRISFRATNKCDVVDPILNAEDKQLYTRPGEGLIVVSNRVRELAARFWGGRSGTIAFIEAAWQYMLHELILGAVPYDLLTAGDPLDWVLDHGFYDCRLGSALFAALCRSQAIPARLKSGYLLSPTAPGIHTWCEIWVDDKGWLPFDLDVWILSVGGAEKQWERHNFGAIGHRLVTEQMPHFFNNSGSITLPRHWNRLVRIEGRGTAISFYNAGSGELVYQDYIEVEAYRRGPDEAVSCYSH
jgi:hypothetical protein